MLERLEYRDLSREHAKRGDKVGREARGRDETSYHGRSHAGNERPGPGGTYAIALPGMKIMFMSGYTADVVVNRGVFSKGVNFIQKPFSMRNLAAKVREALDWKID